MRRNICLGDMSKVMLLAALLGLLICPTRAVIRPFSLKDVQLGVDTVQARASGLNLDYLFFLDVDRLLWTFRNNAGLPTPGLPYEGTWEDVNCEVRGQFMGHYLTALSYAWLTGNSTARERIETLVTELGKVQQALGGGYLSAFPAEHFDRLQSLEPVWAPYYVIHKIMAGLLDAYELVGVERAFPMVLDMAGYFLRRIDKTLKVNGTEHWQEMLQTEFGGMNDVMYRLYSITNDKDHLRMAKLFDKPVFFNPLVRGDDPLGGLHANTHLAQVVGYASRFDVTHDADGRAAVDHFFQALTQHHSYATGGNNDHEYWGPPDSLADAVWTQHDALETEETCTTYNVLKIARALFRWTGNASYADYYERALLNGILGVSRMPPSDISVGWSATVPLKSQVPMSSWGVAIDDEQAAATSSLYTTTTTSSTAAQVASDMTQQAQKINAEPRSHAGAPHADHDHTHDHRQLVDHSEAALHGSHHHHVHASHLTDHHQKRRALVTDVGTEVGTQPHGSHSHAHGSLASGVLHMLGSTLKAAKTQTADVDSSAAAGDSNMRPESQTGLAQMLIAQALEEMDTSQTAAGSHQQPAGSGSDAEADRGSRVTADTRSKGPPVVSAHKRPRNDHASHFIGFGAPPPGSNASNAPGPGVYLYLLPMGTGQSKGDNSHHWGFPDYSFWCCYGTAVESFAKLADSIYFHDEDPQTDDGFQGHGKGHAHIKSKGGQVDPSEPQPPRLYVNQLVTSSLEWHEQSVRVSVDATMYAPGPSSAASLRITGAPEGGVRFVLMLRIPSWVNPAGRLVVQVNSQDWYSCPVGSPTPGTYCQIDRRWRPGDVLRTALPQGWRLSPLQESRPQFAGLKAIMLGPFVMAGLTHAGRHLALPPGGLDRAVYNPEDVGGLLSLRAAWNASLYVRHDHTTLHVSEVEDSGDAIDATFRVISGCHSALMGTAGHDSEQVTPGGHGRELRSKWQQQQPEEAARDSADLPSWSAARGLPSKRSTADWDHGLMGQAGEQAEIVTLESMNEPGSYISFDPDMMAVLATPDGSLDFCDSVSFVLRPGLTGQPGSRSLEAAAKPGWYLSAYMPPGSSSTQPAGPTCRDHWPGDRCKQAAKEGLCIAKPEVAQVHCRAACGSCDNRVDTNRRLIALRLRRPEPDNPDIAAASTFFLAGPLTPSYPDGAKIVAGRNRAYLLVPLGNIVDERYTVGVGNLLFEIGPNPGPYPHVIILLVDCSDEGLLVKWGVARQADMGWAL